MTLTQGPATPLFGQKRGLVILPYRQRGEIPAKTCVMKGGTRLNELTVTFPPPNISLLFPDTV